MKKTGFKAAIVLVLVVMVLASQAFAGLGGRGGGRGPGLERGMQGDPEQQPGGRDVEHQALRWNVER